MTAVTSYTILTCILVPTTAEKALFKSSFQGLNSVLKKQHPKIKDAFEECIGLNFLKTEIPLTPCFKAVHKPTLLLLHQQLRCPLTKLPVPQVTRCP